MELGFYYSKLFERIKRYSFFLLYTGYPMSSFIIPLLNKLASSSSSMSIGKIYLLNFNDTIIEYLPNVYTDKELKAHPNKKSKSNGNCNSKLNTTSIISIKDTVLLMNLISNKISKTDIHSIIIGPHYPLDSDSKILFILKILNRESHIKIIHLSNDAYSFYMNLNMIISHIGINISEKQLTVEVIPRYHYIINKIIAYHLNFNHICINEFNISSIRQVTKLLHQLYLIGIDEFCNAVTTTQTQLKEDIKQWLTNSLIIGKRALGKGEYSQAFFTGNNSYKARTLFNDIFSIRTLLLKSDEWDYATLLQYYNKVSRREQIEEVSLFNYQDSQTSMLISEIGRELKMNLFEVIEGIGGLDKEEIGLNCNETSPYYEQFIDMVNRKNSALVLSIKDILSKYYLKRNYNYSNDTVPIIMPKLAKLIEVLIPLQLDHQSQSQSKESILIIVNSSYLANTIKDALISVFILNDSYKYFTDTLFKYFLISKQEFLKRQRLLNTLNTQLTPYSKSFIENVLLLFESYCLCRASDKENEDLFEQILSVYQSTNDSMQLLPSQIEIDEEEFKAMALTHCFNEETILFPHHVCIEAYDKYSDQDRLVNDIIEKDISHVIMYSNDIEMFRVIEAIPSIIQYMGNGNGKEKETMLRMITTINDVNAYQFYIQMKRHEIDNNIYYKVNAAFPYQKDSIDNDEPIEPLKTIDKDNTHIHSQSLNISQIKDSSNTILIDHREMSAKTPYYLYDSGFTIISSQLEIGDYIPSNTVCIERKSISTHDLHQSLKSTRLTNQIVKMEKYYDYIIILCEFDNISEAKDLMMKDLFTQRELYKKMIDLKNISKKILYAWAISPSMTAKLIQLIKAKDKGTGAFDIEKCLNANKGGVKTKKKVGIQAYSQPIVAKKSIMEMFNGIKGKEKNKENMNMTDIVNEEEDEDEEANGIDDNDNDRDKSNTSMTQYDTNLRLKIAIEKFVRLIDGVTSINYPIVISSFKNLNDLLNCPRSKLFDLLGRINGNKIIKFLTAKYANSK